MPYQRLGTIPFETTKTLLNAENEFMSFVGAKVKMHSARFEVFKRSSKCSECGLEGTFLAVERHISKKGKVCSENYHLNLYAVKDDVEVLMTKDHIIPKAKGGKDEQTNYQTMCTTCNCEKADKLTNKDPK